MHSYTLNRYKRNIKHLLFKIKNIKFNLKKISLAVLITTITLTILMYPVNKITINVRQQLLLNEQVKKDIIQAFINKKFFLLPSKTIEKTLYQDYPNIVKIKVQKTQLGHININITESNYIGIIVHDQTRLLLTDKGKVLPIPDSITQNPFLDTLPTIYIDTNLDSFINTITKLLTTYSTQINLNKFPELKVKKIYLNTNINHIPTIKIITSEKIILFSPTKEIEPQLIQLKVIVESLRSKQIHFKNIDLRFDRPIIK